jgi:hypothetical protein
MLMDRGFHRVRPLAGGLEAWRSAGHELERDELPEASGVGMVEPPT